jgi:hypothetical protein
MIDSDNVKFDLKPHFHNRINHVQYLVYYPLAMANSGKGFLEQNTLKITFVCRL